MRLLGLFGWARRRCRRCSLASAAPPPGTPSPALTRPALTLTRPASPGPALGQVRDRATTYSSKINISVQDALDRLPPMPKPDRETMFYESLAGTGIVLGITAGCVLVTHAGALGFGTLHDNWWWFC